MRPARETNDGKLTMAVPASDSLLPDPALVALNRFGLGARPGDRDKIANDARGSLKAELKRPDIALMSPEDPTHAALMGSTSAIQASMAARMERKLDREQTAATGPQAPMTDLPATPPAQPAKPDIPRVEVTLFRAEAQARLDKALQADVGFVERLVYFWSNHFCVSVAKNPIVRASAGAFEREAIRPFVLGRFADMLLAVERHPAVLFYLDNQQSIGPDSRAGKNRKRGLNENLAREIWNCTRWGSAAATAKPMSPASRAS